MTTTGAESLFESSSEHRDETWQRAFLTADRFNTVYGWDMDTDDRLVTDIRSYADGYLRLGVVLSHFVKHDLIRSTLVDQFEMTNPSVDRPWGISNELVHELNFQVEAISRGLSVEELLRAPSSSTQKWADKFGSLEASVQGFILDGVDDEARATALYKHVQKFSEYLHVINRSAMKLEATEVVDSLGKIVHIAHGFAQKARESAGNAQKAAGIAANSGLATHFAKLGRWQGIAGNAFRAAAILVMILGGLFAVAFLVGPEFGWASLSIERGDYVHLGQRALLLAGIFGLAGYLSKQAHNHRTLGTWASTLAVQLKTFDGYADAVKYPEVSSILRKDFAARVFGDQPGTKGESSSDGGEALVQKAAELISRILPGDK